jgi:hypothetical protein
MIFEFHLFNKKDNIMSESIEEEIIAYEGLDQPLDNLPLFSFLINQQTLHENNYGSDSYGLSDWPLVDVPDSETEKMKLKSGRKRKRQLIDGEKIHDKHAADNILTKIHVHYMAFILNAVNELLNYLGYPLKFIDIDYKNKKELTKKKFSVLKNTSIGQILCQKVSSKFRKQSKQNLFKNNIIFNQVSKNKIVYDFLSQKYITLFKDFYLKNKRNFNENGVNFQFSEKVKTFENLLNKIKNKYDDNDEYELKIEEVIQKYYFTKYFMVKK